MKEKINLSSFLLIILFFSYCICLQSKIDLFQFGDIQKFESTNKVINTSEQILDQGKKIEPVKESQLTQTKIKRKEEETPNLKKLLNMLIEKYEKLKSENIIPQENSEINKKANILFNDIRFKSDNDEIDSKKDESNDSQNIYENENSNQNPNNYETNGNFNTGMFKMADQQNNFYYGNDGNKQIRSFSDIKLPPRSHYKNISQNKIKIPLFPFNAITREPVILHSDEKKDIYIDKALIKKLKFNRKYGLQTSIKSVPIQECQIHWDYSMHGENWSCMVINLLKIVRNWSKTISN